MSALPPTNAFRAAVDDFFFTTQEVADRWRLTPETLSNNRAADRGCPYVKLPTGAVRYRASDVIAAEIEGTVVPHLGACLAEVDACPGLDAAGKADLRARIVSAAAGRRA